MVSNHQCLYRIVRMYFSIPFRVFEFDTHAQWFRFKKKWPKFKKIEILKFVSLINFLKIVQ
jgi:hypothetical protein